MHDAELKPDPAIAQAAADWIVRRDRGLSLAEKRALAEWENADARHRAELRRIDETWTGLEAIRAQPDLNAMADAIVARARKARSHRRRITFFSTALAAAAALAIGFNGWQRFDRPALTRPAIVSESVRVLDSSLRRMALPDGSVAELNGTSRIEVNFSATERRVRLTEGEAHFIVAKNPERPFYVSAGSVTVRAVGTAFNVRLASDAIEVLVTEGKVQLEHEAPPSPLVVAAAAPGVVPTSAGIAPATAPAPLVAGQRAIIDRTVVAVTAPAVAINDIDRAEIDEALGWQTTRLVFNNTPLEEVVAGFNQFNRHQLTIGDPKLGSRTLTGVFRADNLEGFKRLLKASVDVKAELRTPTETVLLPMR